MPEPRQTGTLAAVAPEIRLVALDVDGVLTDGGIYLGATDSGERVEMKRFEITDGLGIHLLQEAGVQVAIVTGRESASVRLRAEELRITECHQDRGAAKLPIMEKLVARLELRWNQVAFLGDDLADLPVLRRVRLPAAVANAVPEVRARALWVARRRGGEGAVREFAEALLHARGEWVGRVRRYLEQREAAG
ncbi:MAG TPA: HAD hydrolase family protein [Longimicrobiaceae bacterium]|nr:HAD hydrolase family protein [Longimicrobiaceae bacterium]